MTVRTKTHAMLLMAIFFVHQVTFGESPFVIPDELRDKMPKVSSEALKRAEDDFIAIVKGEEPIHAKYVEGSYTLDGGSRVYKGDGYKIDLINRLVKFGDVAGKLYGPILKFESETLVGIEVSNVRFLSLDRKLLSFPIPNKNLHEK